MKAQDKLLRTVKASEELEMPWEMTCANISFLRFKKDECWEKEILEKEQSSLRCWLPAVHVSFAGEND